ncbi:CoA-transferase family III [Laetiporus sulphureus 93-53]|uniref:CoA-transferase family III n=1 Tax=Laetiporus sulphureus 93-53 TaxID=1314785 RepID=A0A165B8Q6_9APHY|nr:CoA-transferase family III [Laetiporus sulphureus 93-53]KZT00500.1 CoA-transferase family III [Laetiporus sulphureus 93-53]
MSQAAAKSLWQAQGLPSESLSHLLLTPKPDPAVNSSFKLGTAAQTAIGLSGLGATHFHQLRTGVEQTVQVDARHAVLEFKSEAWYTINGELPSGALFDELAGLYKTKDDSYVRLHTNFPHHRRGILDILQCEPTNQAVAEALLKWNAVEFETEASSRKMVATALRSFDEWDRHPQGKALANTPPVQLIKIADAPKREAHGSYTRPLEGIRVLDLTRVLAGPVCGRTLAAHGADVLLITSPRLPALPFLDADTSRGKRTTQLDLTASQDRATLASLVADADVFLQAYRPRGLQEKGFGPEDVAQARPGIVYASLTAYGWEGPWKDRRGFDSLVQTATGFNVAEGDAFATYTGGTELPTPKVLPMQALDHAAGYLLAFGINAALCKTLTEGGSWEVRVSLAAMGHWIRSLGRLDPETAFGRGLPFPRSMVPQDPEIAALATELVQSDGDTGKLEDLKTMQAISHAAILSKTPVQEGRAPLRLNAHVPQWLPRAA